VLATIEVCGSGLGEVRGGTAAERNSTVDNSKPSLGCAWADGREHPRKISGLAVATIGPEARFHAENALEQFPQKSRLTEVQYCTLRPVECSSELLA